MEQFQELSHVLVLKSEIKVEPEQLEREWWADEEGDKALCADVKPKVTQLLAPQAGVSGEQTSGIRETRQPELKPCSVLLLNPSEVTKYESHQVQQQENIIIKLEQQKTAFQEEIILENLLLDPNSKIPYECITLDDTDDIKTTKELRYKSTIKCPVCNKECRNKVSYTHHRESHFNDAGHFQCKFCEVSRKSSSRLHHHVRRDHTHLPFCICKEAFSNMSQLNEHKLTCTALNVTDRQTGSLQCPHCPLSFASLEPLKNHCTWKHGQNTFESLVDQFQIVNKLKLYSEIKKSFFKDKTLNYQIHCQTCYKDFDYDFYFQIHFEICFKNKNFICPFCCALKKRFLQDNIAVHINQHLDARKILHCDECDALFFTHVNLSSHKRRTIHSKSELQLHAPPPPAANPTPPDLSSNKTKSNPPALSKPHVQLVNIESILNCRKNM